MNRITNAEIRALKEIIKAQNKKIESLELAFEQQRQLTESCKRDNDILWKDLEESRAKEGKGALENMIDSIADAVAGIGNMFSTMSPDELKALTKEDFDHEDI